MEELLVQSGLSVPQAAIYLFLLDHGSATPPVIADQVKLTRTNAYKVLDSLQELGLVRRQDDAKKISYVPADPSALASLVAEQRNRVIALEQNIKTAMSQLRSQYRKSTADTAIDTGHGAEAIIAAYQNQAEQAKTIHFVKSRADIPFMGYETMRDIRHMVEGTSTQRYGITPDAPEVPDPAVNTGTNLHRTLIPVESYTSPIEWTVSGDELLIVKFDGDGEYIRINDSAIADGFREIWSLAKQAGTEQP